MIESDYIKGRLASTKCYKCHATLEGSTFALLNDRLPLVTVGHVICAKCQSQSMVMLTMSGSGVTPMMTDLVSDEIVRFANLTEISYLELLDLHQALKKESLCKLMHKSEKTLEKRISR